MLYQVSIGDTTYIYLTNNMSNLTYKYYFFFYLTQKHTKTHKNTKIYSLSLLQKTGFLRSVEYQVYQKRCSEISFMLENGINSALSLGNGRFTGMGGQIWPMCVVSDCIFLFLAVSLTNQNKYICQILLYI